jgi:molybdate transport system substrate-binding protein
MFVNVARRSCLALLVLAVWLVTAATAQATDTKLTVLAAASLAEPFQEIGKTFDARHPGWHVTFSFAGSQELAQQLEHGLPADVFASASQQHMAQAVTSKRVAAGSPATFAHNRLVAIVSTGSKDKVKSLADLAKSGVKIVLGDESVPVGRYSRQFLDKASKSGLGSDFRTKVLANTVSFEPNVRMVLTKVALGEADAGIAYVSDVKGPSAAKVVSLTIPDALNVIADYPIAPLTDATSPAMAKAFVDLVRSREGQQILARHGFIPITP